jgi:hypothetical protein
MKTIIVSLAALVAVSGAALASDRAFENRGADTYSTKHQVQASESNAFAVVKAGKVKLNAFQRTEENHK